MFRGKTGYAETPAREFGGQSEGMFIFKIKIKRITKKSGDWRFEKTELKAAFWFYIYHHNPRVW